MLDDEHNSCTTIELYSRSMDPPNSKHFTARAVRPTDGLVEPSKSNYSTDIARTVD